MLTQCILYRQLTGDRQFEEMEGSLRDWLFGCNPWGISMIVELPLSGSYPLQPHSCLIFENVGTTTGGLVDGPVYTTIFNSLKGVNIVKGVNGGGANNYEECQPGNMVYHVQEYISNRFHTRCIIFEKYSADTAYHNSYNQTYCKGIILKYVH